jgi:small subunit ribosomal protein S1
MVPTDEDNDFGAMLDAFEKETGKVDPSKGKKKRAEPKVGDVVTGRVASIGHEAVFIDLGAKAEGMIDVVELRDASGKLPVSVGDTIEAVVVETMGKSGCIVLRRSFGSARGPKPRGEAALDQLQQAFDLGVPVEGIIGPVNKGGVEVQLGDVRAFCPISQLDLVRVEDATPFVGQKHRFRITKIERVGRGNVVVSRRALLEEEQAARAAEARTKLAAGVVMRGKVSSVKDYGAFVDLGGLEGLLHVSELGFARVSHPKDVLSVGQDVEVQVLAIGPDKTGRERISLSLKSLEKDPWQGVGERFPEGATVNGKVVRLEAFGAFVELAPGIEGLVHISELGGGRKVNHPREVLKIGQTQAVTVLGVDAEKRRLSLAPADADEVGAVAAAAPSAPTKLGTFGDLLAKSQKPKKK